MDTKNTSRQLRYIEEVRIPLHRAGFGTLPVEGEQLPVLWNDAPLCRITGKGSVFYRREDADTPQAENALYRVEDIAAKTLEYMTATVIVIDIVAQQQYLLLHDATDSIHRGIVQSHHCDVVLHGEKHLLQQMIGHLLYLSFRHDNAPFSIFLPAQDFFHRARCRNSGTVPTRG